MTPPSILLTMVIYLFCQDCVCCINMNDQLHRNRRDSEVCPPPFVLRGEECFFIYDDINDKFTWEESRQRCLSMGGDLAEPMDTDKNDFVNYIGTFPIGTVPLYLGATNFNTEKQWKWVSGENVSDIWLSHMNSYPRLNEVGHCMVVDYHYNLGYHVSARWCFEKATFACKFVPGKVSNISRKSFTHSSLEVDWISPLSYYKNYTLKWTNSRNQDEKMIDVNAPPYNITGLEPCTSYIITVTPHLENYNSGVPNNTVAMATGANAEILGYQTISSLNPWNPPWIGYYNRMGLGDCQSQCSRQVACTAFSFKSYRGHGCIFYDLPIPAYKTSHGGHDTLYMKQGCKN